MNPRIIKAVTMLGTKTFTITVGHITYLLHDCMCRKNTAGFPHMTVCAERILQGFHIPPQVVGLVKKCKNDF